MVNWEAIKTEYITTSASYRDLAKKYGIHLNSLGARAKAEGWVELRKQHRDSIVVRALEADADEKAQRLVRFNISAEKLLAKLDRAIDELDVMLVKKKVTVKTEERETVEEYVVRDKKKTAAVDRLGVRQVAAAMRDLKDILMIRSDAEEEEQQLKNQRLKKIVEGEGTQEVHFVLEGELEDFTV